MAAPRIFVSHSHLDDAFTRRLVDDLIAAGADVWVDVGGVGADDFQDRINQALVSCEWFLLVLTPSALRSPWVKMEVHAAIRLKVQERMHAVIQLLAEPVAQADIPPTWGTFNHFDATSDYTAARDRVLSVLGLLPLRERSRPAPQQPASHLTADAATAVNKGGKSLPPNQLYDAEDADLPKGADGQLLPHGDEIEWTEEDEKAADAAWAIVGPQILAKKGITPNAASTPPVAPSAPPILPPEQFPVRLASLGFVAREKDGVAYIELLLCAVPAGEFLMGSDEQRDDQADDSELPQHRVSLPAFQIARFPVTVAEYACAVRAKAVRKPPMGVFSREWGRDWQAQLRRLDYPVICVSWNDALAYARWLAKTTGQPWRLPSEAEWEKAACWDGRAARIYPWGDNFDKSRCNTWESGKRSTTPVGSYPNGASPCGAQDMAGNVWEWTSSLFRFYPYSQNDGREDLTWIGNRVLRGGTWNDNAGGARAACRSHGHPDLANELRGFRLVCAIPVS